MNVSDTQPDKLTRDSTTNTVWPPSPQTVREQPDPAVALLPTSSTARAHLPTCSTADTCCRPPAGTSLAAAAAAAAAAGLHLPWPPPPPPWDHTSHSTTATAGPEPQAAKLQRCICTSPGASSAGRCARLAACRRPAVVRPPRSQVTRSFSGAALPAVAAGHCLPLTTPYRPAPLLSTSRCASTRTKLN